MQLTLQAIVKQLAGAPHLYPLDLTLMPGAINVLLGATLAGKTSLLRIMAGLDPPSGGRVLVDDRDVTGVSVRERNLAMVYQQFINYPSLTVYENIASPLRLQKRDTKTIKQRVREIAEALRLVPYLDRYPAELSGGQQQRTALARALAKDAELLLLDEPLVNLDYKLRDELRDELTQLLKLRATTVVYATTEPQEALQLGGHTAILVDGRLLQYGPTLDVFNRPASLAVARAFSDPPLNILPATFDPATGSALLFDNLALPLTMQACERLRAVDIRDVQLALRAHQFAIAAETKDHRAIATRVELAEISGSDTYLHVDREHRPLVAQLPGVHDFAIGSICNLFVSPHDLYGFALDGELLFAPDGA